jgi:hypothetical protein
MLRIKEQETRFTLQEHDDDDDDDNYDDDDTFSMNLIYTLQFFIDNKISPFL